MSDKLIRYSEIFGGNYGTTYAKNGTLGGTFQGEGRYTGYPTAWLRLWGCNLECNKFGQSNPNDPDKWTLPYKEFDTNLIKTVEELPVWHTSCDSSYSWSKNFIGLSKRNTASEIAQMLVDLNKGPYNPEGKFVHPLSRQDIHMAFTGGEPMMNQQAIVSIMEEFNVLDNYPAYVTVETNGTQLMKPVLDNYVRDMFTHRGGHEWFWSISPKLRSSGESWEVAIKPAVIESYIKRSTEGQLKYVVDNDPHTWDDVERATKLFRSVGCTFPVWIMPVGADLEMQNENAANISKEALSRGYNVAARVHTYVFGNAVGT